MNSKDVAVAVAIADRFSRWARFLGAQNATPILVVGMRESDHTIVMTAVEELGDDQIELLLSAALDAIRAGRVDHC